ncbi:hypothetical protein C8Q75DRAFT_341650 [Abortiporus biennis]|nr:hypothetical protein C8Q75DRAFT_341650 [Abortiporus biennis]
MSTSATHSAAGTSPQTQEGRAYPLRLPAYQSSHLMRYHPYGMQKRYRSRADQPVDLMKTVDRRYDEGGSRERSSLTLSVVHEVDETGPVNDDIPIPYEDEIVAASEVSTYSVVGFMELVIDFAFAMRAKFMALRVSKPKRSISHS